MDDKKDLDNIIFGLCNGIKADSQKKIHPCEDQQQNQVKKSKKGRKNRGLTEKHYDEYKKEYAAEKKEIRHIKQPDTFTAIEHVKGEVLDNNDVSQFTELYQLTCDSILSDFKNDNADLVKKHPYTWYKPLLIKIKKSVPAVSYHDIDILFAIWDIMTDLLLSIGLYPTFESFQYLTNVYKDQLEKNKELSPKYAQLLEKINKDCDSALLNELQYNPYNQTNKIFIAKSHGIIEQTATKQIEVTHSLKQPDDIPLYIPQKSDKN